METKAMLLGRYIRRRRKLCHMSMATLAKRCDLSTSHISRIETGKDSLGKEVSPSLAAVSKIAKALDININTMLVDSGYVSKETEVEPINDLIYAFLNQPRVVEQYQFDIEQLSFSEAEDAYRIIENAIDLISLKFKK